MPLLKFIFIYTCLLSIVSCGESRGVEKTVKTEEQKSQVIKNEEVDSTILLTETPVENINYYPKNDLESMGLKGQIKSMSIYGYGADEEGEREGLTSYSENYEFNEDGNVSIHSISGCCGYDNTYSLYEYTEDKLLIRKYTATQEHRPTKHIKDSFDLKEKYFYNDLNQLVKVKRVDGHLQLTKEVKYKYDEKGRLAKEEIQKFSEERSFVGKYSYKDGKEYVSKTWDEDHYDVIKERDTLGNIVEEYSYIEDGYMVNKSVYVFDEQSNWIEQFETTSYPGDDYRTYYKVERGIEYVKED